MLIGANVLKLILRLLLGMGIIVMERNTVVFALMFLLPFYRLLINEIIISAVYCIYEYSTAHLFLLGLTKCEIIRN